MTRPTVWTALLAADQLSQQVHAQAQLQRLMAALPQRAQWTTLLRQRSQARYVRARLMAWLIQADAAAAESALTALLAQGLPRTWQTALFKASVQPQAYGVSEPCWGLAGLLLRQGCPLPRKDAAFWWSLVPRPLSDGLFATVAALQAHPQGSQWLDWHAEEGWLALGARPTSRARNQDAQAFAFWWGVLSVTAVPATSVQHPQGSLMVFQTDHIEAFAATGVPMVELRDPCGRSGVHIAAYDRHSERLAAWARLEAPIATDCEGLLPLHHYFQESSDPDRRPMDPAVVCAMLEAGHDPENRRTHRTPGWVKGYPRIAHKTSRAHAQRAKAVLAEALAMEEAKALTRAVESTGARPRKAPSRQRL